MTNKLLIKEFQKFSYGIQSHDGAPNYAHGPNKSGSQGKLRLWPLLFWGDIEYERVCEIVLFCIVVTFRKMLYFAPRTRPDHKRNLPELVPNLRDSRGRIVMDRYLWYASVVRLVPDRHRSQGPRVQFIVVMFPTWDSAFRSVDPTRS